MRKKINMVRNAAVAVLAFTLLSANVMEAAAGAAPDGATKAEETSAAENGAYEAWGEKWKQLSEDWTQVAVTVGADESKMNFAWYSKEGEDVSFRYGKAADMSDGTDAKITQQAAQTGYTSNYVTLENLEENTDYYYQVSGKDIQKFSTKSSDSFSFIFVGDPQIGSSNEEKAKKPEDIAKESFKTAQYNSVMSDSFNWANTLNQALAKTNGNVSFILSAGDQIQTNAKKVEDTTISEIEYAGYLSPSALRSLPVAPTVGNHDADNSNYLYHFNIPNLSSLGDNGYVGGDYCFTYGDVLFINLNTQDTNSAEHGEFMQNAVAANPDCKWRIVTLHQDIYGSAEHSNEPEIVNLRYALVPFFEECDIDVVLTGHDHAYSRSQILKDGVKEITYTDDEFDEQLDKDIDVGDSEEQITVAPGNISSDTTDENERKYLDYLNLIMDDDAVVSDTKNQTTITDPEGILYLTANSASGSKYYDLTARQQTYIAARWQEDVPTYSIIDVKGESLTINTYRTDTNEAIDATVTLVKSGASSEQENTAPEEENANEVKGEAENPSTESDQNITAPKTGETRSVVLYVMIAVVCIALAVAAAAYVKTQKDKEQ